MSKGRISELSPELREVLKDCPYVVRLTNCTIRWSKRIYEEFCREYDKGVPAEQILEAHGIDPVLLGRRVAAFRRYYERNYRMSHTIRGGAAGNNNRYVGEVIAYERTPASVSKRASEKMSTLEQEVAYLTKEVEFLKKIFLLENPELAK